MEKKLAQIREVQSQINKMKEDENDASNEEIRQYIKKSFKQLKYKP